mmetsp:Transcript_16803/g.36429  ORF Transcript_16803/g.36429 Transcript_16803/m.36429 type:complete len:92 (+) Transcript_16803:97-372(+)
MLRRIRPQLLHLPLSLSRVGYIYSETFAADLFSKFGELSRENKSVLDVGLGKRYRDKILSPCATRDGEAMLLDFLGREPSKDAFLASRIQK